MNRQSQPPRLILPHDPGHRIGREQFSALIPVAWFKKIEAILELPASQTDGFRRSFVQFLWVFYLNSLPEAEIKVSRSVLKKELLAAAALAERLEKSATRIWTSEHSATLTALREYVRVSLPSQSSRSMHPSGSGFVWVLGEFALTARWLADMISSDKGGRRRGKAFDNLTIVLAKHYRGLRKDEPVTSSGRHFYRFMAEVVDLLRKLEKRLSAAKFKLPRNDKALSMRLHRLSRVTAQ
jgi:hypothetical protein